jgi:hypothetical protein
MDQIDGTSARRDLHNGQPVWVITLTGSGRTVDVAVDAVSGEILSLQME